MQLGGQLLGHRAAVARAGRARSASAWPARSRRSARSRPAPGRSRHRRARLDLDHRRGVAQGLLEHLDARSAGLLLAAGRARRRRCARRAALAAVHQLVDELVDGVSAVPTSCVLVLASCAATGRRRGIGALWPCPATWRRTWSGPGARSRDAGGVQRAADDVVAHARQVLHAAAADQHHRVLLQVVALAGDVGRDLHAVGQPHARDLAQRRVRLLRRASSRPGCRRPASAATPRALGESSAVSAL